MAAMLDRLLGIALTCTAIVLVGLVAWREMPQPDPEPSGPTYISDWTEIVAAGHRIGSPDASVVVIEFGDFECPFCARFASDMRVMLDEHPEELALVYVHYPLTGIHRFAVPAARASECAAEQERFAPFHELLFEKQDSIGLKAWSSYAADAGIEDIDRFAACVESTDPVPAVEIGLEMGEKVGVRGTPAILINGWFYPGGMGTQELRDAISSAMDGRPPVTD